MTASSIAELASWVSLGEADNQPTYVPFGKSVEIEAGFEAVNMLSSVIPEQNPAVPKREFPGARIEAWRMIYSFNEY